MWCEVTCIIIGMEVMCSMILVNHDFCQIAWLAWFNSGTRIKYDRTCQRSIKIISIENTIALYKSAQKKHFFLELFLKESSWWALFNRLKIANLEKWWFFTVDDTLSSCLLCPVIMVILSYLIYTQKAWIMSWIKMFTWQNEQGSQHSLHLS